MALEGTFSDFGLAEIFQLVGLQKKTGVLTVRGGREGQMVTVSFEKGMVTIADEYQRGETEKLGNILLRSRLVTQEGLDKAIEVQKQTLQRLGHVLTSLGIITQQELRQALQTQVKETVYRLFRWKEGSYQFSSEPVTYDKEMYQPISSEFLIMEGVRMIDEWPIIERKISSFDLVFEKVPGKEPPTAVAREKPRKEEEGEWGDLMDIVQNEGDAGMQSKLSAQEQTVFRLIDGERTVQDLIDMGKLGEFETCKILYSFLSLSLIRLVEAEGPVTAARAPARRFPVPMGDITIVALAVAGTLLGLLFNPWSIFSLNYNVTQSRMEIGKLLDDVKVRRLQHALEVFYLEKQSYPSPLEKLVEDKLLEEDEIRNQEGRVFTYRGGEVEYHLVQ